MNLDTVWPLSGASALPLFSLNWLNVDAVSLMLSTQKKKKSNQCHQNQNLEASKFNLLPLD